MSKLKFKLLDVGNSKLDFGMDDDFLDYLSKSKSTLHKKIKYKKQSLNNAIKKAEDNGDDNRVIKLHAIKDKRNQNGGVGWINKYNRGVIRKETTFKGFNLTTEVDKSQSCVNRLKRMKLTATGMEGFIKKCEAKGDFSVSEKKLEEDFKEKLIANQIIKNNRIVDRVSDELESVKEEKIEENKPLIEKRKFKKMLLPVLAVVVIVFLVTINK